MRMLLIAVALMATIIVPMGVRAAMALIPTGQRVAALSVIIKRKSLVVVCRQCRLNCRAVLSDPLMETIAAQNPQALCARPEEFNPDFVPESWQEILNS